MPNFFKYLFSFLLLSSAYQCSPTNQSSADDQLLARVYNKSLYLSELDGMVIEGMPAEDSSGIVNSYVSRWVRDAVMMHEAEQNVPKNLNIDKLVRDYRASLIRHSYEQFLVGELLDSIVSQQELNAFYEKNKDQYQLEAPIMRCHFIKISNTVSDLNKLKRWWDSDNPADFQLMEAFCKSKAAVHHLKDDAWLKIEDIAAYMPPRTLTTNNVGQKREFTQKDDNFRYFFRVLELVKRKQIAPLSYIEDQASKVILHKRKVKVLEEMKEKMYDDALRKNHVKLY